LHYNDKITYKKHSGNNNGFEDVFCFEYAMKKMFNPSYLTVLFKQNKHCPCRSKCNTARAGNIRGNYDVHNRGGIDIRFDGQLHLHQNSAVRNSRRHDTGGSANVDSTGFAPGIGGGGISVSEGRLYMYDGSQVFNNVARIRGGGIFVVNANSFVTMLGGELHHNFAVPAWQHSSAAANLGVATIGNAMGGGGIDVRAGGQFNMNGGHIHNNRAHRGGGVRVHGASAFIMTGGEIRHNHTRGHANGNSGAGALVESVGSTFDMLGGRVHHNWASNMGGGIYMGNSSILTMRNTTIVEYNRANVNHAGGIWLAATTQLLMCDEGIGICNEGPGHAIIRRNTANNGAAGLHVSNGASFVIQYGHIVYNWVTGNTLNFGGGGGIRMNGNNGSPITRGVMYDGLIAGNRAPVGGGVWVGTHETGGQGAQFTMYGGEIRDNWTVNLPNSVHAAVLPYGGGGGVMIHGHHSVFTMYGGAVSNNTSSRNGGGVDMAPSSVPSGLVNGGTFNFHGGRIEGNRAANGGGIFSRRGIINMQPQSPASPPSGFVHTPPVIHNNTAGIASRFTSTIDATGLRYLRSFTTLDIDGDGGGVYVINIGAPARQFTMQGGSITTNRANNNRNGGGVFLTGADAQFIMYAGAIGGEPPSNLAEGAVNPYANTAEYGGGVWLDSGTSFLLRGAAGKLIAGNIAEYDGGGVWIAQTAGMHMHRTPTPAAADVRIAYNEAGRMGGGIFTQDHGDYPSPLPTGAGLIPSLYFRNITLNEGTIFTGNTANILAVPPSNVVPPSNPLTVLPNINTAQRSPVSPYLGHFHPLNNYDINFLLVRPRFEFYKTDHEGTMLANAHFRLFRTPQTGTLGTSSAYLVTDANSTGVNPLWVERPMEKVISEGPGGNAVYFYMTPGFVYQLVETQAPVGFQRPMGQWRIVFDDSEPTGFVVTSIASTTIPPLQYVCTCTGSSCEGDGNWYLRNWPDFDLPLTGGTGGNTGMTLLLAVAGAIMLVAAGATVAAIKVRKVQIAGSNTKGNTKINYIKLR